MFLLKILSALCPNTFTNSFCDVIKVRYEVSNVYSTSKYSENVLIQVLNKKKKELRHYLDREATMKYYLLKLIQFSIYNPKAFPYKNLKNLVVFKLHLYNTENFGAIYFYIQLSMMSAHTSNNILCNEHFIRKNILTSFNATSVKMQKKNLKKLLDITSKYGIR